MSWPEDVDAEQLAALCERYGIARLSVFGSTSRDEGSKDSDVDLLYELASDRRLGWEIEDLAQRLSALFGKPVDLVSRSALHPLLRDSIEADARELYAA